MAVVELCRRDLEIGSLVPGGEPMNEEMARRLAIGMALLCVRNTCIEDIHAGIGPYSASGDFSDVKVVTPVGEIPWPRRSRMRDDEMGALMKPEVGRSYTGLV